MYLYAPKSWNNDLTSNYLSTGAFLAGSTPNPLTAGNTITSMPTLSTGDVIATNVSYSTASGALVWTMTRTVGSFASQTFSQVIGDLRSTLGGSKAWLGFTAATGDKFAGHMVSNVRMYPRCNNRE